MCFGGNPLCAFLCQTWLHRDWIDIFYYSTLKLRGSCLYWYVHVGFGSQERVSWQETDRGGGRGKVCTFNFAEFGSRSFFFFVCVFFFFFFFFCLPLCCCTCLLFILRSEKEESGWWEKATFSPLWGCSCILPNCLMKGTFVLQWNISPFTSSWCGLPSFFFSFSFLGKRLIFRPDSQIFYSFKVDGKLERICVCVQSLLNGRSGPRGSKYNFWFIECLFYAAQDSARGGCKL